MKVDLELMTVGECFHYECIIHRNFSFKKLKFPSLVAKIYHANFGYILFDTGYSDRIYTQAESFPWNIYLKTIKPKIKKDESLKFCLQQKNIYEDDIKYIIVSHFHPDHIGGICDFSNSKLIYSRDSLNLFKQKNKFKNLINGFIPHIITDNIESRSCFTDNLKIVYLDKKWAPFQFGYDLFGDKSIIIIDLKGHSIGHIGIILQTTDNKDVFLIGDACWTKFTFEKKIYPLKFIKIITDDFLEYRKQIYKIHQLYMNRSDLFIIPSHCEYSINNFKLS